MSSRPHIRNRFVLIGDLALIVISVLGSFALRLDVSELPFYFPAALVMCAVALLVKVPVYFYFGLYRRLWVYPLRVVLHRYFLIMQFAMIILMRRYVFFLPTRNGPMRD